MSAEPPGAPAAPLRRSDYRYDLPPELIAQEPAPERGASRLLALDGATGVLRDLRFPDVVDLLAPGDLLVRNDTRVLPARIHGRKSTGGRVEILVERITGERTFVAHVRSSKGARAGHTVELPLGALATVLGPRDDLVEIELDRAVGPYFDAHGEMPLPPYIRRAAGASDRERYQTVYAREPGAVAAPTAGLHFDAALFERLAARGVAVADVTLHVGAGTFQPVRDDDLTRHRLHAEWLRVPPETVAAIEAARARGGRVVAIGTTVVRSLETAARDGVLAPYAGDTQLFIYPGFRWRVVDALITNFHLPESTLLMLVAAFAGREPVLAAYAHAVRERYRFFSYGDAMFVTPSADARRRG
jgi:S-adenosylmethionine:tRNA ribosyltransferase-isomerase